MEAVQIHGICGFIGVMNVGIFGRENGIVTEQQESFKQFGVQLLGALAIILWGGTVSFIYFYAVKSIGRLRVNKFYEVVGIDIVMHTMSDLIGDNDDFDRDSRIQQYQLELYRQQMKREKNSGID